VAGEDVQVSTPGPASFYDAAGGEPAFAALVEHFYGGVATDPVLRPLYPEADLGPAADRLRMFLEQYWGGPTTYSEQRGHPRLRMRHARFAVTPTARDHWLGHMRAAVDSLRLRPELDRQLWAYLTMAAESLVNADEPDTDEPDTDEPETGGPAVGSPHRSDPQSTGGPVPPSRPVHLTVLPARPRSAGDAR